MADTYVLIQVKIAGVSSAVLPFSGLNVNFIANDVLRQVQNATGLNQDYGQPVGMDAASAVGDEATHTAAITITDATVRSTRAA